MIATQLGVAGEVMAQASGAAVRHAVLALIVMATVLSPGFTILTGMYSPRGEDLILVAVAAVWFLRLPLRQRGMGERAGNSPGNAVLTRIMVGMLYVAVISIGVGAIAFQQPVILNDLMVLPMIVRYWLALQVGRWASGEAGQRAFVWALLGAVGSSALVGLLQHLNLLGINDWLTPLYIAQYPSNEIIGLQLVKMGHPAARVVGTHGDPRHYAYMLIVGMGLCMALLATVRSRTVQIVAATVFALCLVAVAFTASRTAVLSAIIIVAIAILLLWQAAERRGRAIGLVIAIAAVLALASPALESTAFADRVADLNDASYAPSLNARIRDLVRPLDLAFENPIIWLTGRGPSKAEVRTDSHDDFGWCFYRYGLPGALLYLSLILYGLRLGLRAWRAASGPTAKAIGMVAAFSAINWFVFALAENIFKDPQLMALNMLLVGGCVGVAGMGQGDQL